MNRRFLNKSVPLLFLCLMSSLVAAQVTRQPYLQVVTPHSIVVRWDTQTPEIDTVWYGASESSFTGMKSDAVATLKHEITIDGLMPKQKYYYSISGPSGGNSDQYFVTAPMAGDRQSTRIWVVADFGQSNTTSHDTRRTATVLLWRAFNNLSLHADFMLSLGDQSENGTDEELQNNYFNQLQGVLKSTPLYTIEGNHDDCGGFDIYKSVFTLPTHAEAGGYPSGTEDYYSFDFANIHVVTLTVENSVSITGAQKTWLQNDLANNRSDWLIAVMHRPMHSAGYHPTDSSSTALSQKIHWLPLLESAGVDLILAGHNHVYERSYSLDNLTGLSTSITDAHKINTRLGREDEDGPYRKELGQPHKGTIFVNCAAGGTSNAAKYLPVPYPFMPVVYPGSDYEGSLVIDVDRSNRMDVRFLCDALDAKGSHIWDYFTILKTQPTTSVGHSHNLVPNSCSITNYPNPFNPSTKISYSVPRTGHVKISVCDMLGRTVATLVDEVKQQGNYTIVWSAECDQGQALSSGVYIARIQSGSGVESTKMLLLR